MYDARSVKSLCRISLSLCEVYEYGVCACAAVRVFVMYGMCGSVCVLACDVFASARVSMCVRVSVCMCVFRCVCVEVVCVCVCVCVYLCVC